MTLLVGRQEGHPACKKYRGWWRWALARPDGVAPSRMGGVSASVNLPLHHKVQKFSSGTGSPGWSQKKGHRPLQPWTQHRTLTSLWTVISRCRCMSAPCVAQHFASCDSYVRSCDRCRLMRPRQVVVALVAYCNLSSIRHFRHRAPVPTGRTECCSTLGHWHPKV